MSESDAAGLSQSQSPAGPVGEPVPCATCRQPIDPLRATRVTMYGERFQYFCSVQCRERFDVAALTPLPQPRRRTGSVQSVEHDRENDSRSIQRQ
ncbi:MAG TPA: hypothetical protein VGJ84_08710, partial [Polyangiaceae bacterium]